MNATFLRLPLPPLFSFDECRWFLDRNYDDCLHTIEPDAVTKAIRLEDRTVLVRLTARENDLHVQLLHGEASEHTRTLLASCLREWLDMDRDLAPFYQLLGRDERLAYMQNEFRGLRLIGIPDLFEALIWCIIGQQIHLRFAHTLKQRLVERYGTALEFGGTPHYVFPSCHTLAAAQPDDLRAMQFSRQKIEYIIGTAQAFASGAMSKQQLLALPDVEAKRRALTVLKGIGVWTANYALMKSLQEQRCIPHGDVGLLKALTRHGIIRERRDTAAIEKFFAHNAGWESYLVFYLWRSLAVQ